MDGFDADIYYAIDIIGDLAALLLECKMSGSVKLSELWEYGVGEGCEICIMATPEDHEMMNKALFDFVAAPMEYDLSEMVAEEDMSEMAEICEELRKELYG